MPDPVSRLLQRASWQAEKLHLDIERRAHEVIALEAHAADAHLPSHRCIVQVGGVARLAALGPIEVAPVARFGSLISK